MPRRREAEQEHSTRHPDARYVLGLIAALASYGGYNKYELVRNDKEQSEIMQQRFRAEDVSNRRIEALENRLQSCGQRGFHG